MPDGRTAPASAPWPEAEIVQAGRSLRPIAARAPCPRPQDQTPPPPAPSEPISRAAATASASPASPLRSAFCLIGGRLVTLGFAGTGHERRRPLRHLLDGPSPRHSRSQRPPARHRHQGRDALRRPGPRHRHRRAGRAGHQRAPRRQGQGRSAPSCRQGGRFVRIKRELTPKQQAEIHELGLPGLGFIEEYRRVYPVGATASHVVGLVDVDNKGLAGIEKFIDDNPQLTMTRRRGG